MEEMVDMVLADLLYDVRDEERVRCGQLFE